jgi:plasmid stabilization system protein ParE
MDFKVIFRDSFLEDLESLLRLIAADNPATASKLGDTIVHKGERLAFFPERYPKVRHSHPISGGRGVSSL